MITLDEYRDAVSALRDAKHRIAANGRHVEDAREITNPGDRYAWLWLHRAERHLRDRLDAYFRKDDGRR